MTPTPGPRAGRGQETAPPPAGPKVAHAGSRQAAISGDGLTLDRVRGEWGRVIAEIRKTQPTVGNFLQEGTLQSLEGSVLTVVYGPENRFHMSQVMKNREAAEQVISAVLGESVRLSCRVDEGVAPAATEVGGQAPTSGTPHALPGDGEGQQIDPTLRSVLDTFDGELV